MGDSDHQSAACDIESDGNKTYAYAIEFHVLTSDECELVLILLAPDLMEVHEIIVFRVAYRTETTANSNDFNGSSSTLSLSSLLLAPPAVQSAFGGAVPQI
jgi:hypothetical protein